MDNQINNGVGINIDQSPLDNIGQGTGILDRISEPNNQEPPTNVGQGSANQESNQNASNQEPPANAGQGEGTQQEIDYKAEYEKLKKSYEHLRPEYTRVTQELSQLRKQAQSVPPSAGQQVQQPQQPQQQTPQLYQDPASGLIYYLDNNGQPVIYNGGNNTQYNQQAEILEYVNRLVQPLYEHTLEVQMQNEIAKMAMQKQDFNDVAPIMKQVLEEMPQLWELGQTKALEVAYSVGKTKLIEQQLATAVNDAKNSVLQNKDVKVLTGGSFNRPANMNGDINPADAIKNSILEGVNKSSIF